MWFDVALFVFLAVMHATRADWSALYFGAQALVFGLLGWRWREDQELAERIPSKAD
jgi:hypothetical protein